KSLSANISRAPRIQTSAVSPPAAVSIGGGAEEIDHASADLSPGSSGCGIATDGPSSHGLFGGGGSAGFCGSGGDEKVCVLASASGGAANICVDPVGSGCACGVAGGVAGNHGWAGACGCPLAPFGPMWAWIRSSAERRNSRARRLVG